MSRKGNCHDNSVMENFFGILKQEYIMEKFITAMKSLNKQLSNTLITTTTRESNRNSAG